MIIDGKKIAEDIQKEQANFIQSLNGRKPTLVVILVGNNPASEIYVNTKTKACHACGIHSIKKQLDSDISEEELLLLINSFNKDQTIDAILVQLPLPKHIDQNKIMMAISPTKDVDGFHPINLGKLMIEDKSGITPCTPLGIKVLFEKLKIETKGKNVLILGRSTIVGKPMASLLMSKDLWGNATVTLVHGSSTNIEKHALNSDILISAIGHPHFIKEHMVKEGAVIIDVGINRIADQNSKKGYKITGDVDFENVYKKCSFITPVPGGVGPMTISMLLNNTIKCYLNSLQESSCIKNFHIY